MVFVGNLHSTIRLSTKGLLQGFSFSPCVFIIFVVNILRVPRDQQITILQFADDTEAVSYDVSGHSQK